MVHLDRVNSKFIDGQKLFFFSERDWLDIISTGAVDGINLNKSVLLRLEKIDFPISKKHPEITIVGGFYGYKPFFQIYTLLTIDNFYQRVQINKIVCQKCKWEGYFANPNEPEIYLGVSGDIPRNELMKKSHHLLKENCPHCNSDIKRKGIWFGE